MKEITSLVEVDALNVASKFLQESFHDWAAGAYRIQKAFKERIKK
jgi:hypothetical protein